MLIELDGALQLSDAQLKGHNGAEHLVLVVLIQITPLLSVRRLVVADELFEQTIFGKRFFNQTSFHFGMHRQIAPCGHTCEIWIYLGRHISLWAHERHQRWGAC